jgi:hypothetical protein
VASASRERLFSAEYWQNEGSIMRIYTTKMAAQFEADLRQLKAEYGL